MFAAFSTFGLSEWLRLALTVLLCIPLFVVGMYLFGLFPDIITGKDTAKRKSRTDGTDETASEAKTDGAEPK